MSFLDMMSGYMMMLPQELTSEIMPVYRRTVALVNVVMDEMIRVLESMNSYSDLQSFLTTDMSYYHYDQY